MQLRPFVSKHDKHYSTLYMVRQPCCFCTCSEAEKPDPALSGVPDEPPVDPPPADQIDLPTQNHLADLTKNLSAAWMKTKRRNTNFQAFLLDKGLLNEGRLICIMKNEVISLHDSEQAARHAATAANQSHLLRVLAHSGILITRALGFH